MGKQRVSEDWPRARVGLIVWERSGAGARGLVCEAGVRAEGCRRLCEVSASGPAHCTRDGDLGEPEASGPRASASRGWKTPAPHEHWGGCQCPATSRSPAQELQAQGRGDAEPAVGERKRQRRPGCQAACWCPVPAPRSSASFAFEAAKEAVVSFGNIQGQN